MAEENTLVPKQPIVPKPDPDSYSVIDPDTREHLTGIEVYHWPEFKALMKKLGAPYTLNTIGITLEFTIDDVTVKHNYRGSKEREPEDVEEATRIAKAAFKKRTGIDPDKDKQPKPSVSNSEIETVDGGKVNA